MDKIKIKKLELFAHHGVLAEEAVLGQKFLLSMDLCLDTEAAGKNDALNKTVNYAEICAFTGEVFTKTRFQLLEAAGEHLCRALLLHYPLISAVELEIEKPWAPIGMHLETASLSIRRERHTAYLGLGTNMGDLKQNMDAALLLLNRDPDTEIVKVSSYYRTAPWGYTDQPDFLNSVVKISTLHSPKSLLELTSSIENTLGRTREIHWGPRTMDVDILFYDDLVTQDPLLTLPHPRIEERMFVLEPLTEVEPMLVHPLLKERIFRLRDRLKSK